jgi:anti-sigma B factor antagonist
VRALRASVAAGESGPVITLSGEADIASAVQLTELIGGQLNAGALHLTINAPGLSYVDSMAVQVLVVAAKILRARGGGLVLFRPQRQVARTLTLMGADQVITIRRALEVAPQTRE